MYTGPGPSMRHHRRLRVPYKCRMSDHLPEARIRLILADDHDLVRFGIKALLSTIPTVEVVSEASNGAELITLVEQLNPDLVITDLYMPGIDGITAITHLRSSRPQVKLMVLSSSDATDHIKQAVACGACGYVMKDAPAAELEQAVRSVIASGSYFSSKIMMRLLQVSEPTVEKALTQRQAEILTLLAKGHASKEIAFQLGLSSKTVDVHKTRIMQRLQLHDLASLALYAARKGLVKV